MLILPDKVYLYTHYGATELPDVVKNALARGEERWTDPEYLARIIFSDLVRDDLDGLTGYGIGTEKHCDVWRVVVVDCKKQTVSIQDEGKNGKAKTFKKFIS